MNTSELLKARIVERLREDPGIDPQHVTLTMAGAAVTLDGSVDSAGMKRAIQNVVEQFEVDGVQNNLRVAKQGQAPG